VSVALVKDADSSTLVTTAVWSVELRFDAIHCVQQPHTAGVLSGSAEAS
jgi:3-deoxy-D-manno-octulosonic acid (KDO) 8-phosphate synthase